jgi:hypothetical protein
MPDLHIYSHNLSRRARRDFFYPPTLKLRRAGKKNPPPVTGGGNMIDLAENNPRLSDNGSTFYQYGSLIAQHFYKTALDIINCQVIAFIF